MKIICYAYGIKHLSDATHLHYWIDEHLQYHEELKDTPQPSELLLIKSTQRKVELHGPGSYTISSL